MLKILCPTDFSDHSKKALEYAFNISRALKAEIHLITSFVEHRHSSSLKSIKDYVKERNEKELQALVKEYQEVFNLSNEVKYAAIEGHAIEAINFYAKTNDVDAIILGTQGSKSINNRIFGSTTSKLIQKSKIPIIAIPYHTSDSYGLGNYLLAVDDRPIYDSPGFKLINQLCESLNKKVDIIHVKKGVSDSPSHFDPYISDYLSGNIDEVIIKEGGDAVQDVHNHIERNSVELLIMIRHEHTLINRLMYSSNTDREISQSKIPIMIIPEM